MVKPSYIGEVLNSYDSIKCSSLRFMARFLTWFSNGSSRRCITYKVKSLITTSPHGSYTTTEISYKTTTSTSMSSKTSGPITSSMSSSNNNRPYTITATLKLYTSSSYTYTIYHTNFTTAISSEAKLPKYASSTITESSTLFVISTRLYSSTMKAERGTRFDYGFTISVISWSDHLSTTSTGKTTYSTVSEFY